MNSKQIDTIFRQKRDELLFRPILNKFLSIYLLLLDGFDAVCKFQTLHEQAYACDVEVLKFVFSRLVGSFGTQELQLPVCLTLTNAPLVRLLLFFTSLAIICHFSCSERAASVSELALQWQDSCALSTSHQQYINTTPPSNSSVWREANLVASGIAATTKKSNISG